MLPKLPAVPCQGGGCTQKKRFLEENSVVNGHHMPCPKRQEVWRLQHFKAHTLIYVMPKPVRDAGDWLRDLQH